MQRLPLPFAFWYVDSETKKDSCWRQPTIKRTKTFQVYRTCEWPQTISKLQELASLIRRYCRFLSIAIVYKINVCSWRLPLLQYMYMEQLRSISYFYAFASIQWFSKRLSCHLYCTVWQCIQSKHLYCILYCIVRKTAQRDISQPKHLSNFWFQSKASLSWICGHGIELLTIHFAPLKPHLIEPGSNCTGNAEMSHDHRVGIEKFPIGLE